MDAHLNQDETKPAVLMVGPMAPAVGGIATVVEQLLHGPLTHNYLVLGQTTNTNSAQQSHVLNSTLRHLGLLLRLARRIHKRKIDIVHIHTCSGFSFYRSLMDAWTARRLGCRTILHIHGGWFNRFCSEANPIAQRIIRHGLGSADSVVVLGETWRAELATFCPKANIMVVPNAVSIPDEGVLHANASDSAASGNHAYRFLFLGDISNAKGIDTLIASAAVLKEQGQAFSLTLAGAKTDDYAAGALDQLIARNGLTHQVSYVGVQKGPALGQLLADCDCLVLPSLAEGLPMSILEAGACGKAVIASKVGAIPELLLDETFGVVIPPSNVHALVHAMENLASNPKTGKMIGDNLKRRIGEHYSLDHQATVLDGLYREMLTSAQPTRVRPISMVGGVQA